MPQGARGGLIRRTHWMLAVPKDQRHLGGRVGGPQSSSSGRRGFLTVNSSSRSPTLMLIPALRRNSRSPSVAPRATAGAAPTGIITVATIAPASAEAAATASDSPRLADAAAGISDEPSTLRAVKCLRCWRTLCICSHLPAAIDTRTGFLVLQSRTERFSAVRDVSTCSPRCCLASCLHIFRAV